MIVDTSAIVAIVSGESGAQVLKEALERSPNSRMSAPNYVELCAIMQRRDRPEISRLVDRLLDDYGIQVEAVDADQARVAAQAYRDYGRGSGHPARLNLGDTYSYALAQVTGEPLLFRGDDFTSGPRAPEPRLRYIRYMHRGYALVVCSPGVTRTMIDIDDDLLARAAKELGTTTKKDTVHAALRAALRASAARSLMNRMAENATGTQDEALVNAMWRDGHPENTA